MTLDCVLFTIWAFTCSKLTTKTLEQGVKYVTYFTPCSSVSIVNVEHVNADWVCIYSLICLDVFKYFGTLAKFISTVPALRRYMTKNDMKSTLKVNGLKIDGITRSTISWKPALLIFCRMTSLNYGFYLIFFIILCVAFVLSVVFWKGH